jgi:hypothetical protein
VYWERDAVYAENLRYFLRAGVTEDNARNGVEYLIIVQDHKLSVEVPAHVRVWKRENTCYDFGAVGEALRTLDLPTYRFYVILCARPPPPVLFGGGYSVILTLFTTVTRV